MHMTQEFPYFCFLRIASLGTEHTRILRSRMSILNFSLIFTVILGKRKQNMSASDLLV